MAQVINTNTMSLNAQRNLSTSGNSLATTIQRLSSGLRINSAKDDAAGLAISERFSTQIRGLDVAIRNANDGISLAQVAEGSLSEVGNNLQRIRELAVQASNATNSSSDRKALQAEVTQLVSEIDRVAKQSDFNGTKLLDGSFTSQLFQVGANAGQAIAINSVVDAKAESLGAANFLDAGKIAFSATDMEDAKGTLSGLKVGNVSLGDIKFDYTPRAVAGTPEPAVDNANMERAAKAVAAAINNKLGETGLYAAVATAPNGAVIPGEVALTSVKADGNTTDITVTKPPVAPATTPVAMNTVGPAASPVHVADIKIDTVAGAQQALSIVDKALESVNSVRADLGAIQNRFTSVVANLQTSSENLSASRSRIRDTDFAKETAELTRTQILQQAGTAMLAQANQVPQNVLSLLQR
ncbi:MULTISPECIES: flagellin [Stenotrophomonas]|uniref:flagellin n=1 Tax=Stenotrophomonas TaxID=40323 RepID=UPI001F35FA61|nr:flagellin [Stenotrophomonas sp. PA-6-5C]MCF5093014.1 flagellin [Stenotrophomonas sp. PA-6-5C]